MKFRNAINEISQASFEACYGSSSSLVLPEETPTSIEKFKEAAKSHEARRIFGRLLCLKQKFQTKTLQQTLDMKILGYEKELQMWFKSLSMGHPLLFDVGEHIEQTLAFVVDDTGSMSNEIDAAKKLVKAIIKAEKFVPFFYILGTFNDTGNNINYIVKY